MSKMPDNQIDFTLIVINIACAKGYNDCGFIV